MRWLAARAAGGGALPERESGVCKVSMPQSLCSAGRTDAASSPVICSPNTRWRSENHKEDKFLKARQAPAPQRGNCLGPECRAVSSGSPKDAVSPTPDSKGTSGHLPAALFLCSLLHSPPLAPHHDPKGGGIDPMYCSYTPSQLLTPESLLRREHLKILCGLKRPMKSTSKLHFC